MSILSKEVKDVIDSKAVIIIFFGLPEKQQIEILPVLEKEQKYDFPDGDLITDSALEILVNDYNASLNSILLHLDEPIDDKINDKAKELFRAFDNLFSLTSFIQEKFEEDISNEIIFKLPEWNQIRELSLVIQKILQIQSEVNKNFLKSRVAYWLHP
ncbi:MAG: hypothetical protein KI793_27310 [Rivularia sp. (in: Bacteria)]|nr:hypothetical protein [Rivularia sp. MS3]